MDYDVSAVALSVPPVDASLTTYRPAIEVRNNGRFSAVAAGVVQAYKAGLRVYSSPVTSPTIAPGETGIATAADDWLPESQGDYILFGYVSTYRDQVEPNNNLAPVTIHVGPEPPTPPPSVPPHAPQHEHGGSDTLSVEDLPGVLADPQPAEHHASSHQAGGDDTLNISGLPGVASNPQIPTNHGNEHHNPDFATSAELVNHQNATSVHTAATNLANRDLSGDRAGLVTETQLVTGTEVADEGDDPLKAGIRVDHLYGPTNAVHHAAKHEAGGLDPVAMPDALTDTSQNHSVTPAQQPVTVIIATLSAAQAKPGTVIHFMLQGTAHTAVGAGQIIRFKLRHQTVGVTDLITTDYTVAANKDFSFHIDAMVGIGAANVMAGVMHGEITETTAPGTEFHADGGAAIGVAAPAAVTLFYITAEWVNGALGSTLTVLNALALGISRA